MNENKSRILIIAVISLFSLCGCDYWKTLTRGGDRAFVIKGTKTISGQTIEFKPGTRVRFEAEEVGTVGGTVSTYGELVLTNGARLIARGTPDNPIVFESSENYPGGIIFKEDSDGANSVIEYCEFRTDTYVSCENSVTIQYCKFGITSSSVILRENCKTIIQYNDFTGSRYTTITGTGNHVIQFNNFIGGYTAISVSMASIKYNNINNMESYAIGAGFADSNYIANCNGKQGVDIDGKQVYSNIGSYTNPQISPISNAGCGW